MCSLCYDLQYTCISTEYCQVAQRTAMNFIPFSWWYFFCYFQDNLQSIHIRYGKTRLQLLKNIKLRDNGKKDHQLVVMPTGS